MEDGKQNAPVPVHSSAVYGESEPSLFELRESQLAACAFSDRRKEWEEERMRIVTLIGGLVVFCLPCCSMPSRPSFCPAAPSGASGSRAFSTFSPGSRGFLHPAAASSAQAGDGLQLLRPIVADFSAGGLGGRSDGGLCADLFTRWAARSTMLRSQPASGPTSTSAAPPSSRSGSAT